VHTHPQTLCISLSSSLPLCHSPIFSRENCISALCLTLRRLCHLLSTPPNPPFLTLFHSTDSLDRVSDNLRDESSRQKKKIARIIVAIFARIIVARKCAPCHIFRNQKTYQKKKLHIFSNRFDCALRHTHMRQILAHTYILALVRFGANMKCCLCHTQNYFALLIQN